MAIVAAVAMLGGVAGVSATAMADDQSAADTQQTTATTETETPANTDSKDAGTDTGNKDDLAKAAATKSDDAASADTDAAASELTKQTAPAPTSTLNAQATEATNGSCVYAGTVASGLNNVCWLDMANFTAAKKRSQSMRVKLSDSLTMKFNIKYTGGRTLHSAAVPTWNKAAFGHYGYTGFPEGSKPALYQNTGSANTTSTVELADIKIVKADGSEITGNYSFMMADAESTNTNESISFTSSNKIEQVAQFPQQGDANYKNYAFGDQTFSADHKTVTGGGVSTGANPGIYLYKTKSPDTVSVTMRVNDTGEIQAAIFGVLFSNAETTVTTNNASDTFAGEVESQTYGSEQTDGVTGSNSATSKVVNMLSDTDVPEQVKFTLSSSENTNWNDYDVSFTCDGDCGEYDATPQIDTATGNRYVTVSVASEKSAHGKWVVTKKVKLDTPKIQKSISKDEVDSAATGQKDSYTLSLNVKGNTVSGTTTSGEKAKIDVVFVLDTSGSMKDGGGNSTRLKNMQNAITSDGGLSSVLFNSPDKIDAQAHVITFASDLGLDGTSVLSTKTDLDNVVNGLRANGGTHWEKGLKQVRNISTRPGATKYVVFLTDGNPGESGWSSDNNTIIGGDYNNSARSVYNASVTAGKQLAESGWNILNVGVDMPETVYVNPNVDSVGGTSSRPTDHSFTKKDGYVSPLEALTARENANKSTTVKDQLIKAYPKTTSNELAQVFKDLGQIITTTTTKSYGKVSIVDTLSDYVDPLFGYDKRSGEITSGVTVVTSDGSNVDAEVASKTYDAATRTVTVTFKDGFTLAKDVTYSVQFKVKPSDKAYETYALNKQSEKGGYTDTDNTVHQGETGTGTDSENKDGFYSNTEAHLAYSECTAVNNVAKDCVSKDNVTYQKPVLQVKTGKIQVTKNWHPDNPANDTQITFELHKDSAAGDKLGEQTVSGPSWSATFENLAPGKYVVVEKAINGYTSKSDNSTVEITRDGLWEAKTDDDNPTGQPAAADNVKTYNVAFTNARNKVNLTENSIKVKKTLAGRNWQDDDSFTFNITAKDPEDAPQPTQTEVTVSNRTTDHTAGFGVITYSAAGTYKYTVTESQNSKIAGLLYSGAEYEVTVKVAADANGALSEPTVSVKQLKDDNGKNLDSAKDVTSNVAEFTNRYVAVSSLPLTGGKSARDWLVYGGGLGLMALLAAAGYTVWRKRQLV
ncbi:MAG: Spy0128 family protein [Bifidobacterium longum]